jgi:hypothetical protein
MKGTPAQMHRIFGLGFAVIYSVAGACSNGGSGGGLRYPDGSAAEPEAGDGRPPTDGGPDDSHSMSAADVDSGREVELG